MIGGVGRKGRSLLPKIIIATHMKNRILQNITKPFSVLAALALVVSTFGFALGATPSAYAATAPTTNAATSVTSTNATLNGTNGDTDATGSSFWVSTSTFSTASPILPAGVYSTPDLGPQASSTSYSASLSSATGLPPVTPGTTYYFAAWTEVGGAWSPGAVMQFTTVSSPTITSISPATGSSAGGTSITITGTQFNPGATVMIGGASATSVVVASKTSITATTLAGTVGAQDVVVTNTDGGTVTSTGGYTYTTPIVIAAPTVTSITPTMGTTTGGTSVVITGTGFTGATAVHFGSDLATITASTSPTSITVTSPATTTAGTVDVTVTTPAGTSATSSADHFTYQISGTVTGGTIPGGVLHVDSITPVKTSATADGTFANGWSYLFNITVPTTESNLSMEFANWFDTASDTMPVAGNMRISSAQASDTTPVTITAANTFSSPALHMVGNMSTSTAGLHVQVLVETKIPANTVNGTYTTTYGVQTQP